MGLWKLPKQKKYLLGFVLSLAGGLAWNLPGLWGPALSILLVIGVSYGSCRSSRFLSAVLYFLAGSWGIVPGAGTFFGAGPETWLLGLALWLGSSIFLALPWIWAGTARGIILALALDAFPPLGLFGWLSPLSAAGVFFPGWGIAGILLLLYWMASHAWADRFAVLWLALLLSVATNLFYVQPNLPDGWVGLDTQAGLVPVNPLAAVERNQSLISEVLQKTRDARVVVLPETVAGYWWPGTAAQFRNSVPKGQIWLVGASVWEKDGQRWDALVSVTGRDFSSHLPLLRGAFPVPVSMWHPWKKRGYAAGWWEKEQNIAGKTVFANICYDQLLPWVWMEALGQRPDLILAVSNVWWAKGTGIPGIEQATTAAWSRLLAIPALYAINN